VTNLFNNRENEDEFPELMINTRNLGFHRQSYHYKIIEFPQTIEKELEQQTYYNNCYCNEYNAMIGRHFTPDLPEKSSIPALTNIFEQENDKYCNSMREELFKVGGYQLPNYWSIIKDTKGAKKKRYERAYQNIMNKRMIFGKNQSGVQFFVKIEKWPISKIERNKPPRGIQFRTYEYLLALKRSVLPLVNLTKINKQFDHGPSFNPHVTFTKNNVPKVNAMNLKTAWDSFKNPVGICLDHTCWDGHYSEELLEREHRRYARISGQPQNSLLMRLCKKQIKNRGFTMGGIRYKVKGKRCSGEYTTSHGNGESNYLMIRSVLLYIGVTEFIIFVNGDDSVIICDVEDMEKIVANLVLFKNFNMVTEIEKIAHIFEEITFCQSSPVNIDGEYTMIRKPMRVLDRIRYTSTDWSSRLSSFYVSLGLCELSINKGVPILQDLAVWLIRKGGCDRPLTTYKTDHYDATATLAINEIVDSTRASFELAFGISVYEQLSIEKTLRDDLNDHPDHIEQLLQKLNHKLY